MTFGPNLVWWHHLLFQVLDLHDNQLASLPADIGQLTALQVKDLLLHPRCTGHGIKKEERSRRRAGEARLGSVLQLGAAQVSPMAMQML